MELEKPLAKSGRRATCPDHGEVELLEGYRKIRTGYTGVVRKIMHIGKCPIEGCTKWCEITLDYIMWS